MNDQELEDYKAYVAAHMKYLESIPDLCDLQLLRSKTNSKHLWVRLFSEFESPSVKNVPCDCGEVIDEHFSLWRSSIDWIFQIFSLESIEKMPESFFRVPFSQERATALLEQYSIISEENRVPPAPTMEEIFLEIESDLIFEEKSRRLSIRMGDFRVKKRFKDIIRMYVCFKKNHALSIFDRMWSEIHFVEALFETNKFNLAERTILQLIRDCKRFRSKVKHSHYFPQVYVVAANLYLRKKDVHHAAKMFRLASEIKFQRAFFDQPTESIQNTKAGKCNDAILSIFVYAESLLKAGDLKTPIILLKKMRILFQFADSSIPAPKEYSQMLIKSLSNKIDTNYFKRNDF